jgi:hypothetical protein
MVLEQARPRAVRRPRESHIDDCGVPDTVPWLASNID